MVKKSASHRGVEDVAPYKHIFLFFGKAFMEPRHYGGVFVLQKNTVEKNPDCVHFLFLQRAEGTESIFLAKDSVGCVCFGQRGDCHGFGKLQDLFRVSTAFDGDKSTRTERVARARFSLDKSLRQGTGRTAGDLSVLFGAESDLRRV